MQYIKSDCCLWKLQTVLWKDTNDLNILKHARSIPMYFATLTSCGEGHFFVLNTFKFSQVGIFLVLL